MEKTHKQILRISNSFVKGLLPSGNESMCYAASTALQGYLHFFGVTANLCEGELKFGDILYGHYWLELQDKTIIDPTASQFNQFGLKMPNVYMGAKPDCYTFLKYH